MRICSVEGCGRKHVGLGYCRKHYYQVTNYGSISKRTFRDPNTFIIEGDICWIILYNKYCIEVARTKIDTIYYKYISNPKLKWSLHAWGYVITFWRDENNNHKHTFLHEAIIQLSGKIVQSGEEIDHIDGDKLNNLDNNLRICSRSQNEQNKQKQRNNTSGHKGVSWRKRDKKWQAEIQINYKKILLGRFDKLEDAARAYNIAAIKHFGEFAQLNKI